MQQAFVLHDGDDLIERFLHQPMRLGHPKPMAIRLAQRPQQASARGTRRPGERSLSWHRDAPGTLARRAATPDGALAAPRTA